MEKFSGIGHNYQCDEELAGKDADVEHTLHQTNLSRTQTHTLCMRREEGRHQTCIDTLIDVNQKTGNETHQSPSTPHFSRRLGRIAKKSLC